MAKGSIEIVAPQQADDATAEPDTFGIARGTAERMLRFGEFIDFLRLFCRFLTRRRSLSLVGRLRIVGLGQCRLAERANYDRSEEQGGAQSAGEAQQTMMHGLLKF